jgi:hypothetical protein
VQLNLIVNENGVPLKVNADLSLTENFPLPHSAEQGDNNNRLKAVSPNLGQKKR